MNIRILAEAIEGLLTKEPLEKVDHLFPKYRCIYCESDDLSKHPESTMLDVKHESDCPWYLLWKENQ